jgi:hypothetical protein
MPPIPFHDIRRYRHGRPPGSPGRAGRPAERDVIVTRQIKRVGSGSRHQCMRTFRYGPRLALCLVAVTLLATACGGGALSGASSDSAVRDEPAAAMATQSEVPATESLKARPQTGDSDRQRVQVADAQAGQPVEVTLEARSIVYVGEMTVRAKDVTAAVEQAKRIVTGVQGYLAREESNSYDRGEGSATLVFKIPPGAYQNVLGRLGKELGRQEALQQGTEDVTQEVADVGARLKSAESALDSLRTLLKKADTIGEVLQVEREINKREAELESLQARQKSLAGQTSMATLTLRLIGPVAAVKQPEDEPDGFLGGLAGGWRALKDFVKVLLTVAGALLPWMIVIIPAALLGLVLLRRMRNRRPDTSLPGNEPVTPGEQPATG